MYDLATRQDPSGQMEGPLWPEQAVTRRKTLEMGTINAARTFGIGDLTGSISVGRSADFLVLNHDPFECDVTELLQIKALQTWFAGTTVYQNEQA